MKIVPKFFILFDLKTTWKWGQNGFNIICGDESNRDWIIIPKITLEVGWFKLRGLFKRAYF